jgi:hypothetical protein
MIVISPDQILLARFTALRTELADLAYELECQGRCDAADITNHLGVRLAEFASELGEPAAPVFSNPEINPL